MIRRTMICLCGLVVTCAIAAGAFAMVRGIYRGLNRAGPVGTASGTAAESTRAASSSVQPSSVSSKAASSVAANALPAAPENDFDDAVFIGDSRTEGLENYNGLGNAEYYTMKGLMVNTIYTKPAVQSGSGKVPIMQALQSRQFGKVYIMLGVNELGWSSTQKFVDGYGKMLDDIKKYQKHAKIYVQSILPVSAKKAATDKIYNNSKIASYNKQLQKLAVGKKAVYLAVNAAIWDKQGNLPESASTDGVHLNQEYCKKWCEYLKTHTK